jgi:hypothetical protein
MTEASVHRALVFLLFALAVVTFVGLRFVTAPYGRHRRRGWGPEIPARLGWVVMESPAVLLFAWIYLQGAYRASTVPLVLLAAWQFHYVHRTFLYPFRMRNQGKRMPVAVAGAALAFNCLNAYVNARWISHLGRYAEGWLVDPRFLAGTFLFACGWLVNFRADSVLLALRRPGEAGYRIPRGGLFELVACPNYLGELVEWIGWAVMTWSPAGLAFAAYTAANLAPRALAHRRWYRERFPEYPSQRRALLPYLW